MDSRSPSKLTERPDGATPPERSSGATLLVFTLGARCESRRRRLLPPAHKAIEDRLHQACLDSALAAGRAAGLRLEVSSPLELVLPADVDRRPQNGPDFGTRLEDAVARTFADRGGPVVLVGSDVPDLEARYLCQALKQLDQDPDSVVIGPSPDGGFYLLAASRPLGPALSQVRWRCRHTLRSLKRALRRQGRSIVLLRPLVDLDRRADLEHWLAASFRAPADWSGLWSGLMARLVEILSGLRRARRPEAAPGSPRRLLRAHRLRGPPLAA